MDEDETKLREAQASFDPQGLLNWLCQCVEHDCPEPNVAYNPDTSPRRLVDVGSENEWPCMARVVEVNAENFERYAAISHVWGTGRSREEIKASMTTTVTNQQRLREAGTRLAKFPKRYRAVSLICRRLKIKYLWIDALCILQVRAPRPPPSIITNI